MRDHYNNKRFRRLMLGISLMLFSVSSSQAQDVYLAAQEFTKTMPDGTNVTMWGFASCDPTFTTCGAAASPGPMITVPAADPVLNINLKNNLTVPTSVVIPALPASLAPVKVADGAGRLRAQSFTYETAAGATGVYSWSIVRPGTFIYQSGSHPAVQVQMGLYGGVKKNFSEAAPGVPAAAYSGINTSYNSEVVLFYSEIDPALHAAVAGGASEASVDYNPKYALVNGDPYSAGQSPIPAGNVNDSVLVRLLSAAQETHVPIFQGLNLKLIAEDGNLYPYPKERYSVNLPAGKTIDAVLVPNAVGVYPVYDGRRHAGMLACLSVSANSAPVAVDDTANTTTDTAVIIPVLANDTDADGNALTVSSVTNVTNGTAVINADNTVTFTPNAAFTGTGTFDYTANDGTVDSTVATVTVTVSAPAPVNSAPVAVDDPASTVTGTAVIISVLANDTDADGNALTVSSATNGTNGTTVINADNTVTYTPNTGFTGTDTFTYTANDGTVDSNAATVTVTVSAPALVNSAPVAVDDPASTVTGTAVIISVLTNDTDADGNALTVSSATNGTNGTTVINADNTVTYTPNTGFTGTDTFTYTANDGTVDSNAATVTVTVSAPALVNSAPVAVDDPASTVTGTAVIISVLTNDTDADGNGLTVSSATNGTNGTTVINADNTVTYTPNTGFTGTDTFTYTANDGTVDSNAATVTVTVSAPAPVNSAPVAVDDPASTVTGTAVIISVLTNDTDADGNGLTVSSATNGTNGTTVINADNTVTYTPNTGFTGTDTFTYTANDGTVDSNQATVTVTVTGITPASAPTKKNPRAKQ